MVLPSALAVPSIMKIPVPMESIQAVMLRGSHPAPGGGRMTHRAVWKMVDNNTQNFDMYGAHRGGKETKILEITYTRKQ